MYTQDSIESLLLNELRGLCINCAKAEHCSYRNGTDKIIIQCEMYQLGGEADAFASALPPRGLCTNCYRADSCQLPGRRTGIWHCEEYE
ncbi:MAG TPA: hypothetical protein VFW11_06105 [Cyclobacteriaceae bacterium]|nr:hypothetical protein [Cyclobacteriaceae bacterium]